MRALTWQGNEQVEVADVPDPVIQEPNDIVYPGTGGLGSAWAARRTLARQHGRRSCSLCAGTMTPMASSERLTRSRRPG